MNTLWTIQDWQKAYQQQQIQLQDLISYVASFNNDNHAWISISTAEQLQAQIDALKDKSLDDLPLYGIPFAVKDNIDVAGFYTTAACKEAAYLASSDAWAFGWFMYFSATIFPLSDNATEQESVAVSSKSI